MSRNKRDSIENGKSGCDKVQEDPKPSGSGANATNNYVNCETIQINENKIQSKSEQDSRESDSESSEDEYSRSLSVLEIMAKYHGSISHSVSLIHKETSRFNVGVAPSVDRSFKSITDQTDDDHGHHKQQKNNVDGPVVNELSRAISSTNISDGKTRSVGIQQLHDKKLLVNDKEIEAVSRLLGDANVKKLIKSVAGDKTTSCIDKTLETVNSSKSIQEKRAIVTGGIKQLHSDLLASKDKIARDPIFSFALGVAGINSRSINFE